jgi:hypothetical protein
MTGPRTPGDALSRAAQRMTEQREAAQRLSEEIAAKRQAELDARKPQEGEESQ